MKLRGYSKDTEDEASTSTPTSSVVSHKGEYVFPERLAKVGDWRKAALSNKCNGEPSTSLNLALVFDFFNKFCSAFNLSKVTEDELYEAVHANTASLGSRVLIRMCVELLSGFSSIDCTHQMRMYHRNRVYRETNEENYNISLWEFFEHDWKLMRNKIGFKNLFTSSKESADLFKFEPRVRAAILYDLCQYRLTCMDAQDIIDSVIDESDSPIGDQLRTLPIGTSGDEQYYYLGGIWVYRSKPFTRRTIRQMVKTSYGDDFEIAAKRVRKKSADRCTQEQRYLEQKRGNREGFLMEKETENGVVRMDDSVEGNELKGAEGDAMDSCFEGAYPKASDNSATTLNVFKKEDGILESRPVLTDKMNGFMDVKKETMEGINENLKEVPAIDSNAVCDTAEKFDEEEYFESLREQDIKWEVVCKNEDDIHFLIEYLRGSHKAGHSALSKAMIDVVLPSVQKTLHTQRAFMKKKSRFMPVEADANSAGTYQLRHSRRLEEKRIEREKRMEEERKLQIEMENTLRERKWMRSVLGGKAVEFETPKQLSREERAKQREQRIEQYNLTRRMQMEHIGAFSREESGVQEIKTEFDSTMMNSMNDDQTFTEIGPNTRGIPSRLAEEHNRVANSNIVELQSMNVSEHPGLRIGNEMLVSDSESKSQITMMVSSLIPQQLCNLSVAAENETLAKVSLPGVPTLQPTNKQHLSSICTSFQQADNNKYQYQSREQWPSSAYNGTGNGPVSCRDAPAERLTLAEHDTSFVGNSSLNIYDDGAGALNEGSYSQPTCSRNGVSDDSWSDSDFPIDVCCSEEDSCLGSSARTRPLADVYGRAHNPQPVASNSLPASSSSRSMQPSFDGETGDGSGMVLLQEERPASADFYKTSRVLSRVYDNVSPSVVYDVDSYEEQSAVERGYVDYPSLKDGQLRWFRIMEPLGTRVVLKQEGPLREHDYYMPTVEQIVTNGWRFSVEPQVVDSSYEVTEFALQFEEMGLPKADDAELETPLIESDAWQDGNEQL
uniref:DDT domain-containing protein n=1 Tax=Ascaris lumbricoides TaxID=6252 RepID=A0A9J2PLM2_ASCLU